MILQNTMPNKSTMYKALLNKDSSFEGIFFVAVKTTGIFCRPTCTAKKPKKENVEFFPSSREAVLRGYRPCKVCSPLEKKGEAPDWLKTLIEEVEKNPSIRLKDFDLIQRGINPSRVRRWFKQNLGMTFQSYLRTLRIGEAFGRIKFGEKVIKAAFSSEYGSLSGFNSIFKKTTGFTPNLSKEKKLIYVTRILTPLGPMLAGAVDEGICLLEFVDRRMIETQLSRLKKILNAELISGNHKLFAGLNKQLKEYFEGKRKEFEIPLVINGSPFQMMAWNALLKINYGETASYKKQAEILGIPKSVRAVGKANGDNRIAIIIPCHRVIGGDGKLVGYGGGIWRKQFLLNLEKENSK
jgi:AraC family transcriptional regulator, regulatory protein of adaptative response / methylated-DNA-[protein]-cysteine methyltransferase